MIKQTINNKFELANILTNLFNQESSRDLIINALLSQNQIDKIKYVFGDIVTYLVCTRSDVNNLILHEIINCTLNNDKEKFGNLIVNQLKNNLIKNKIKPTNNNILNLLRYNFVDNGFYMHAFNGANLEHIKNEGLNGKHKFLEKERLTLQGFLHYDYDHTSYKVFATTMYQVLYSYGNYSPEWLLYYLNKDSKIMVSKNKELAIETILNNAINNNKHIKEEDIAKITICAQKIIDHFFQDRDFAIAITDKTAKDIYGTRYFGRYDDETPVNDEDFIFTGKQSIGKTVYDIIDKYSTYEVSTYMTIPPSEIAIAQIPNHKKLTMQANLLQKAL